tara:strand:+ start:3816 stop:4418 length:603 start_codon:yes stop_codon:yes gene_type:complete
MTEAPRIRFTPLPQDDPLHAALCKVGELYSATNFMTWWDARAFAVSGPDLDSWDPFDRSRAGLLASFVEQHVLVNYSSGADPRFEEHVAKVGRVDWQQVRDGLLDALRHHPVSGGSRPGTAAGQFSPHAFMLLDLLEDQIAGALELNSGELHDGSRDHLRCALLHPRQGSAFEGTLYQYLFLVWAPASRRLLWFDLGGSQ